MYLPQASRASGTWRWSLGTKVPSLFLLFVASCSLCVQVGVVLSTGPCGGFKRCVVTVLWILAQNLNLTSLTDQENSQKIVRKPQSKATFLLSINPRRLKQR